MKKYLVVGAGFSGAVLARRIADGGGCHVRVIDARGHVAGNCHTERDQATGVLIHRYGPHIFHTDSQRVWDYVNSFAQFRPFVNRVKASTRKGVYSLPINLHTINQFFGTTMSPDEARRFVGDLGDRSIGIPENFEDQALKFIGKDLYETFFRGYTIKQWGCDPRDLPASILKRLPVRFSYEDNYYSSLFQGIPTLGYTALIESILNCDHIEVETSVEFEHSMRSFYDHVFFTGPIDSFYDYRFGRLGYRTVTWEREDGSGDMQGSAVINYPDLDVPFTRVHEYKHFAPWEQHERSMLFREFSKETEQGDIPYYPKRLASDKVVLESYLGLASREEQVSFLGRLGTYRYLDMHEVIAEALEFADRFLDRRP
jgi:UDP-galactopyranose mutase